MPGKTVCPICGKEFSTMGLRAHNWRVHGDGVNFDPNSGYKNGTRKAWNYGLTKETDDRVKQNAEKLKHKRPEYQLKVDDDGKLYHKYLNKKINARKEGLNCLLTFEEYCNLVSEAGLVSSKLGFTGAGFVLARLNDSGDYTYGNCRFILQKENAKERKISEKARETSRANMTAYNKFKTTAH